MSLLVKKHPCLLWLQISHASLSHQACLIQAGSVFAHQTKHIFTTLVAVSWLVRNRLEVLRVKAGDGSKCLFFYVTVRWI